jgi:hypothetical protein
VCKESKVVSHKPMSMLKFHSTGESGVLVAEVFFANKRGASILKSKSFGEVRYEIDRMIMNHYQKPDIDPFYPTVIVGNEIDCNEVLESIRILSPD